MLDSDWLPLALSVIGLAISAGGLAQTLAPGAQRNARTVVLVTAFAMLIGLSAVAAFSFARYENMVRNTAHDIRELAKQNGTMTAHQIYSELYPPIAFSVVNAALERLVEDNLVGYRVQTFNIRDGQSTVQVSVFLYSPIE